MAQFISGQIAADAQTPARITKVLDTCYVMQYVLNKSLGGDYLHISDELVESLKDCVSATIQELEKNLATAEANGQLRGFRYANGTLSMLFPDDAEADRPLFQILMDRLAEQGPRMRISHLEVLHPESERYAMNRWLMKLGCDDEDSRALRARMFRDLGGYCAFGTIAQAERHRDRVREMRAIKREIDEEYKRR